MPTVKSLYEESLKQEESSLAHYILHLLQDGKVRLDDDVSELDFDQADHEKVAKMIKSNELKFSLIKVFALKYTNRTFAFVLAKSADEAKAYLKNEFGKGTLSCYEMSLDTPIARGKRTMTFREIRKEEKEFPALAGVFTK